MTEVDAVKVLKILTWADHGCSCCVADLFDRFRILFPEHVELANQIEEEFKNGNHYGGIPDGTERSEW